MATIASLNVKLTAGTAAFEAGLNKAAGRLKSFDAQASKMRGLENLFGESSALGKLGKVAAGAGAVGGLVLLTRQLNEASKKALELRDAFEAGSISAGELVSESAKLVPVLGEVWELGGNIREFFTQERKMQAFIDKTEASMRATAEMRQKAMEDLRADLESTAAAREAGAKSFDQSIRLAGMEENARAMAELEIKLAESAEKITQTFAAMIKKVPRMEDAILEEQAKSLAEAARQFEVSRQRLQSAQTEQFMIDRRAKMMEEIAANAEEAERMARAAADTHRAMESRAASLLETIKTPLENYNERLAELRDLLEKGFLNSDSFNKLQSSLQNDLIGGDDDRRLPPLIEAGSAEARRFMFESSRGLDAMRDNVPQKQLIEQQETNVQIDRLRADFARVAAKMLTIKVVDRF